MKRCGVCLAGALCAALLSVRAAAQEEAEPPQPTASDASQDEAPVAEPEPVDAASFQRTLVERVRASVAAEAERDREREARFRQLKEQQEERLRKLEAQVASEEAASVALDTRYGDNELAIQQSEERLTERMGQMGELFGVVRLVATDLSAETWESLTNLGLGTRTEVLDRLGRSKGVPSTEDLVRLWYELQREMTLQGRVATDRVPVLVDEEETKREELRVTRAGPFTAFHEDGYLRWDPAEQSLIALGRQPPSRYLGTVGPYLEAADGGAEFRRLAVDPSRGVLLEALTATPSPAERIAQGGYVGYAIVVLGLAALLLGAARWIALTVVDRRLKQQEARGDEASDDNPLGRLLGVFEAHRKTDPETLELILDAAMLRERARVGRYLWIVLAISVIAPLLGLLGTVTGMIQTFQAITLYGTGDPKMMAGGISEALVTTMLGLVAAIPLVVLYGLLERRVGLVTGLLEQHTTALLARVLERKAEP